MEETRGSEEIPGTLGAGSALRQLIGTVLVGFTHAFIDRSKGLAWS